MVRRHELEKESLLDTLEVVRAENHDMHARYHRLTSDLHAEVTRVLELERELERRDSREVTLIDQIQNLESELMELRYLDFQLNSTADQTLGSKMARARSWMLNCHLLFGRGEESRIFPSRRAVALIRSSRHRPRSPRHRFRPNSSRRIAARARKPLSRVFLVRNVRRCRRAEVSSRALGPCPCSMVPEASSETTGDRNDQVKHHRFPRREAAAYCVIRIAPSAKPTATRQMSPTLLGISLPKDDSDVWNIPDEQLPEIEDEILPKPLRRPHEEAPMLSAPTDTIDSRLGENGHLDDSYEQDEDRQSTVQHHGGARVSSNGFASQRDVSSSLPRSTSEATVTKSTAASQLPRPASILSKIPTSRSASGMSDTSARRSVSSRLPRLGLKPSSRYTATTSGNRTVSNTTDKSTASTLSSVYSSGAPPSLGSLPSGNNTMEDEIQAELKRLGNPKPFMRYYSPPRSKMV